MNTELLRRIADAIESQSVGSRKVGLNMLHWHGQYHACGTSACVAGYTELIETGQASISIDVGERARVSLALSQDQAHELFYGEDLAKELGVGLITAQERINASEHLVPDALRWMADNETIDWRQGLDHACSIREKTDERP